MSDTFKEPLHKHWEAIYQNKKHKEISWHQTHSTISLDWILHYTDKNSAIIDVGSGVSVLADNLLEQGYDNLSLLELSPTAIQTVKARLKNDKVTFYNQNILNFETDKRFNLWHDRAVFHFLTDEKDQQDYLSKLKQYLQKDGYFLLSTFALTGPKQCSALDIVQYDSDKITRLLGDDFKLLKTSHEKHPSPNGKTQDFNYFLLQKTNALQ
ncbi:SAM-dependent methyltransferases [uncultured Candidatus Thioglobus sp.]|nr:SAM-dependent methyltransferases [uncultured Candidatus Thioglobus sp.]